MNAPFSLPAHVQPRSRTRSFWRSFAFPADERAVRTKEEHARIRPLPGRADPDQRNEQQPQNILPLPYHPHMRASHLNALPHFSPTHTCRVSCFNRERESEGEKWSASYRCRENNAKKGHNNKPTRSTRAMLFCLLCRDQLGRPRREIHCQQKCRPSARDSRRGKIHRKKSLHEREIKPSYRDVYRPRLLRDAVGWGEAK